ncbi:MAG: ATP--guanido phosphotransferase [Clostridia bacterium]|nr:ATP--guanido phosphotransferase [Clostridia bacterium]
MYRDIDTVISSRVRLARNLKDYPYMSRIDKNGALEIIERVKNALGDGYSMVDYENVSVNKALSQTEKHEISREFALAKHPHALFSKDDTKIMVCEEDHIRLQVIKRGFMLEECYKEALESDLLLLNKLNIDYSDTLGYLTQCPTNLGTAMRVSVMMFLPGICISEKLKTIVSQLDKLGLTIRGMYGEGSESGAYIYQISNRETLGISEEKIIAKVSDIVTQITEIERKSRNQLKEKNALVLEDKISRAMGTLKYAKIMSSEEFARLYALVRLGTETDEEKLDILFSDVMPHTLCEYCNKALNEYERDIQRANYIKNNI